MINKGQKVYTAEERSSAVMEYLRGGRRVQTICRKYGMRSTHTFRNWLKVYKACDGVLCEKKFSNNETIQPKIGLLQVNGRDRRELR